LALVDMTVVEQRYRAVLAVERGEPKALVAAAFGVSRQTLHTWLRRYAADGLGGLIDRSHRPDSSPHHTSAALETRVCEIRREHPRWGPRRIAHELARTSPPEGAVVSRTTVHRILRRNRLIDTRPRKRPRESYIRWEREAPMALGLSQNSSEKWRLSTAERADFQDTWCMDASPVADAGRHPRVARPVRAHADRGAGRSCSRGGSGSREADGPPEGVDRGPGAAGSEPAGCG
jgi:transposase